MEEQLQRDRLRARVVTGVGAGVHVDRLERDALRPQGPLVGAGTGRRQLEQPQHRRAQRSGVT